MVAEGVDDVATTSMSFASKILSCLSMFFVTPSDFFKIATAWYNEVSLIDVFALAVFGWCTMPMVRQSANLYRSNFT